MSFDHKAYTFDWIAFERELLPWLTTALVSDDENRLAAFVDQNLSACRNPYDSEPLTAEWREALENSDAQEIADFALTKYYDPDECHGLSTEWRTLEATLPKASRVALLGTAVEAFDPGRMGSYFVTPQEAGEYGNLLLGTKSEAIVVYREFLLSAAERGLGIYVTF